MNDPLSPIASFVGPGAAGNKHFVLWDCVDQAECIALSQELAPTILVYIDRCSFTDDPSCYRAAFYSAGRMVKRCGSGSLAAAFYLSREFPHIQNFYLATVAGRVRLGRRYSMYAFELPSLSYSPVLSLRPWQGVINQPLYEVVAVGGKSDYVILSLASEKNVRETVINARRLSRLSGRSVIVTAPSATARWDYVLRYFAPQYGPYEDAATGSANAMVATYWQTRCRRRRVLGRQLSKAGGEFVVERAGLMQRVMGKVKAL